jgi:type I restriction enzyme S subunit
MTGTAIKRIILARIRQMEIELAPLAEQRRIVAEIEKQFSRLDEGVANLQRVKANLKRYTATVLHAAIAGRLTSNIDAVVDGEMASHLPHGWQLVRTDQAGDVLLGRQRAPQYLTGKHSKTYLRVANIKDDAINYDDLESMDFDETHFAKYRLMPGDILVSEGQSPELLGQSAIFRGHAEPLCFQKTLHRFRARPNITTAQFAQIVFRAHVKSGVFRRIGSITTNIGHLTLEKFRAAPFPLPPLAEQHRIVAEVDRRLSIVREVEIEVDANLKRAQALRQAVLRAQFGVEKGGGV